MMKVYSARWGSWLFAWPHLVDGSGFMPVMEMDSAGDNIRVSHSSAEYIRDQGYCEDEMYEAVESNGRRSVIAWLAEMAPHLAEMKKEDSNE